MNENTLPTVKSPDTHSSESVEQLAQWLLHLMREPRTAPSADNAVWTSEDRHSPEGHLPFCQQLPDFVMALLLQDAGATVRFAPLVYHLVGCDQCHRAYLECYDALRAALATDPASHLCEQENLPC